MGSCSLRDANSPRQKCRSAQSGDDTAGGGGPTSARRMSGQSWATSHHHGAVAVGRSPSDRGCAERPAPICKIEMTLLRVWSRENLLPRHQCLRPDSDTFVEAIIVEFFYGLAGLLEYPLAVSLCRRIGPVPDVSRFELREWCCGRWHVS
jgi:hypothetical protein